MTAVRLPAPWGLLLDRNKTIAFEFDGKRYEGFAGDTLSSGLAANGQLMMSRSLKYHRPRGSASFAGWDANSYVQVGNEPNVQGDLLPLADGLVAQPQNVLGSLDRDLASVMRWFKRLMPVGFYYRAFFRPKQAWRFWEPLIRRSAGLGRINPLARHEKYCDKEYLFCDVIVVGAGPAGLSAVIAAASEGKSVILVEESPALGGALNYARFGRPRDEVAGVRASLLDAVAKSDRIKVLTDTTVSAWFADSWVSMHSRNRLYKVRAGAVVLATGSVEQPAVFRNNDLPGVLTASATQRLLRLYGVRPGTRAVIVTTNRDGHDVAEDLAEASAEVLDVISLDDIEEIEALASRGNRSIVGVRIRRGGVTKQYSCDLLVNSVGYAPLGQLACHDGGRLEYDSNVNSFAVCDIPAGGHIAGSVNHVYDLDAVLADGEHAGRSAAGNTSGPVKDASATSVNHPYPVFKHRKGNEFVDFDEDQTIDDLVNAVADGFSHPELAKRYSTTAMGPSQGRMSASNALRIVVETSGGDYTGNRITTQRPPFRPVPAAILAGRIFKPERHTPLHDYHLEQGASMMPAGLWQRPAYYGPGRDKAVRNEVAAVRNCVGVIDVSTLGGIEVRGPDAAELLDRLYTFAYQKQPVGKSRYTLMVDDSGSIVDDGVAVRFSDQHFYVTTTTTGSDVVYRTMLKRIAEWRLQVSIANVTSQYAAMNIAGPKSRQVIERLESSIDFSAEAFPYLAVRNGDIEGIPLFAMRIGFVGELGYELHVPWSRARELWDLLFDVGAVDDIRPVGVEAQRVLRLEKGHIIVGQDTDGLSNPLEAGMGWAVSRKKPYFVGRAAIASFHERGVSRVLVGFELQPDGQMPEECNLVLRRNQIAGRVTSVAHSEELDRIIGLAYVDPADAKPGSRIEIKLGNGELQRAAVVELPFLDPDGRRQGL